MPVTALDASTRDLQLLDEEFMRSIRRRDPQRLVDIFFTPDAVLLAPGHPACAGRDAIRAWLHASFDSGLIDIRLETNQYECEHDLACSTGRYSLTLESQPGILHSSPGSFLIAFRRQFDGHFRAFAAALSPDPPTR